MPITLKSSSLIFYVSFSISACPYTSFPSELNDPPFWEGHSVEDGLFFANHTELVGQFSNGKTAVANNEQITKGIEEAAYRGMVRALNGSEIGSSATFEIVGDPNGMFKVMQRQASQYTKPTGRNAFG